MRAHNEYLRNSIHVHVGRHSIYMYSKLYLFSSFIHNTCICVCHFMQYWICITLLIETCINMLFPCLKHPHPTHVLYKHSHAVFRQMLQRGHPRQIFLMCSAVPIIHYSICANKTGPVLGRFCQHWVGYGPMLQPLAQNRPSAGVIPRACVLVLRDFRTCWDLTS